MKNSKRGNTRRARCQPELAGLASETSTLMRRLRGAAFACLALSMAWAHASGQSQSAGADRCVWPAAEFHRVNPHILRAILVVESNLKPGAVSRNKNGSLDVGIAQTNSIHFNDLARHGITPESLLDPCVSTYVAAWQLSKHVAKHGNNWETIARYHSATPALNRRYQILLRNELVRAGVLTGHVVPVPRLSSTHRTSPRGGKGVAGSQTTPASPRTPSGVSTNAGSFGAPSIVIDGGN